MPQDSRIAYIINQLGELRELLLVIEQSGTAAPDILLKLAREKAESIDHSTRELRSPQFWAELQKHDPFADAAPHGDNEPSDKPTSVQEAPDDKVDSEVDNSTLAGETDDKVMEELDAPWDIPVTPVQTATDSESETAEHRPQTEGETESQLHEPEVTPLPEVMPPTGEKAAQPEPETPQPHEPDESQSHDSTEEEEPLYPWEQMSDEELSAAQNDKDDYDDDTDDDIEADYEDTPAADLPADDTPAPVTLEEALQRQQAKELRKALSLNDRFRFRRELFGNSDIRMNETLALIDAMSSYDEAEDYILNDLNWDIDNPEVAEFMKIVQKHFL